MKTGRFLNWGMGVSVVGFLVLLALTSCSSRKSVNNPPQSPYVKASDWVANANWAQAETVTVRMAETSPTEMAFVPDTLRFVAGRPYVLRIKSDPSNAEFHYFAPEGATDFFKAVAVRKVQTSNAEYKAPYFKAVELYQGKQLDIYFVPVLAGNYDFLCTITGHRGYGMHGRAIVTGGTGYQLDLEVDPAFNTALSTDPRTSGSHSVWSTSVPLSVTMVENTGGTYAYNPSVVTLKRDTAYVITVSNPAGNIEKHYYTAAAWFKTIVTRKFEDSDGEIKAPYFNAVECLLKPGGTSMRLYAVPTVAGTFEVHCTVPGHQAAGMEGSLVVNP